MALKEQLDRLAAYEQSPYPVVSLYLNTQPNERGRDEYRTFVRKEFKTRSESYPAGSPERESLDHDLQRITRFLDSEVDASANGVAVFACSGSELFETLQLDAPIDQHWLSIGDRPNLYPLARLDSQYPRYAALLADTNSARILVFAGGALEDARQIENVKTKRTSQGGWSQARYQRHIENFHLQHTKEVVDALEGIVQRDGIEHIILAGDEVVIPLLREQLPKPLAAKIVDELKLPTHSPDHDVLDASLAAMRKLNERTDRERVDAVVGAYRAGGLGVVGPDATLLALTNGQVDELLLSSSLRDLRRLGRGRAGKMAVAADASVTQPAVASVAAGEPADADPDVVRLADTFVQKAQQTGARIVFIEDTSLLEPYGGVAATLRYRI
ncbi:MAG TPA: Vms1/Ankzf1 family peptidyl-tRNA hydrolase [Vicinamibacterales bacterium]|nr:Vms1/Ankzf1 family peptidyl-tRNA hydrolase [Vicinamibacterales bacterium]